MKVIFKHNIKAVASQMKAKKKAIERMVDLEVMILKIVKLIGLKILTM